MNYALITGASRGIGYEFALIFAKYGYNLILVSRSKYNIIEIANNLEKKYSIIVIAISKDLCLIDSAKDIYERVKGCSVNVKYLINNAGFYVKGKFKNTDWQKEIELIYLQCITHTHLTKLFLPNMLKENQGGILNIASTGSFVPGPNNAIYCAAKSFVLSFSEALAEEVSDSEVSITVLCPGGTKTEFQQINKNKKSILLPLMEASEVAKIGYNALMKNKRVVVPGLINKFEIKLIKFLPRKWIARLAGSTVKV